MNQRRPSSLKFYGPVQGVHTGDVHGDITYNQHNHNDQQVLSALAELLEHQELWSDELEPSRVVIENAVATASTEDPSLRPAMDKVMTVAGSLVLAVLGNSTYDVLKSFLLN